MLKDRLYCFSSLKISATCSDFGAQSFLDLPKNKSAFWLLCSWNKAAQAQTYTCELAVSIRLSAILNQIKTTIQKHWSDPHSIVRVGSFVFGNVPPLQVFSLLVFVDSNTTVTQQHSNLQWWLSAVVLLWAKITSQTTFLILFTVL